MGRLAKCRCGLLCIVETCGGYDTKCGYDNEWCRAVEVADDGDWTSFDIIDEDECQEHKERCTIPELLEKIAEGKMRKFFEENTLLNQAVVGEKESIRELLARADKEATVVAYKRFALEA